MALRDVGKTTIALDVPTRSMLKQLAGDMHVSDYVRALAQRELSKTGKGVSLPGHEKLVSDNTLADVRSQVCDMNLAITALCKFFHLPQSWAEATNEQFPALPPNELELEVKELQLLASKLANRLSGVTAQQNMIFEGGSKVE